MGEIFAALAIGLVGGFAGGLLGIGGGAIYVPAMVLLLHEQQHLAQGASLAAIIATGIAGGLTHPPRQNVHPPLPARRAASPKGEQRSPPAPAVPGEGNPNADIVFIGEGPGFYEDQQARPFVGPALGDVRSEENTTQLQS